MRKKAFCLISLFFIIFSTIAKEEKKARIAVLDFSAKMVSEELADAVVENLITSLVDSGVFEVIERNQLQKLMKELKMQNSSDFNDQLRKELGNLYGTELVILGSVTKIGQNYTINIRGVEVSTGVAKFAKNLTTNSENDIPYLIPQLVYIITSKQEKKDTTKVTPKKTKQKKEIVTDDFSRLKLKRRRVLAGGIVWTNIFLLSIGSGSGLLAGFYYNRNLNQQTAASINSSSTSAVFDRLDSTAAYAIICLVFSIPSFILGAASLPPLIVYFVRTGKYSRDLKKLSHQENNTEKNRFTFELNFNPVKNKLNLSIRYAL